MQSDPRRAALDILVQLESSPATLDRLMDSFHAASSFSRRDTRFVNALGFGVQRWRYRLDFAIAALSAKPLRKSDRQVLNILRMGLYQILEMDRVPDAAVVHTAVDLARAVKCGWAAGYINAILRRALREPQVIALPARAKDPTQALAVSQSFPEWMISRWCDRFGLEETQALCRAVNRIPPLVLRTNRLKTTRSRLSESLQAYAPQIRRSDYTPEGLLIDQLTGQIFDSRPFEQGWFQVQDEAAQAVGHLVDPRPGETVLDACAGLGGKSAHLAELMQNRGRITAIDRDGAKLERLEVVMRRLGIAIVKTQSIDWLKSPAIDAPTRYDKILLDAPCSGMGVLRRNPDAKWKRKPKGFKRYRAAQRDMLAVLVPLLKPGGALIYAVCSTEPEETEDVLQWFLKKHPQFAIDKKTRRRPASIDRLLNSDGCLQTAVHRHGTDGFFAARLRRRK
ncbi:MAG: 16S rRNA (cytosine(967)-C(5))-methyltransferase RsmB [Desulfosarcina sp.]|nr:16S rRNA (cytosine(967)-C(5))-methyltransferase RsmB [Desulfobacterales bacterium]